MIKRLLLFTCLSLSLSAWAGKEITTAEEAIARAQAFMRAVGWTTSAEPVTKYPISPSFPTVWSVEYPNEGEFNGTNALRIDRATGQIHGALNMLALHTRPPGNKVTITAKQANAAAQKVLSLAGIPMTSLRRDHSGPERHTAAPPDQQWRVGYYREYAGYQFLDDSVTVFLHPRDASLISLRASLQSPTPKSVKVAVKEGDARRIGEQYLATQGRAITRIASAKLRIVLPNHYYEKPQPEQQQHLTRLAWLIRGIRKNVPLHRSDGTVFTPHDEHYDEVWVDAITGNMLGGIACR